MEKLRFRHGELWPFTLQYIAVSQNVGDLPKLSFWVHKECTVCRNNWNLLGKPGQSESISSLRSHVFSAFESWVNANSVE